MNTLSFEWKWLIEVLVTFFAPALAVALVIWIIDSKRLKHELFDRRIKVYDIVATYIANIISKGDIERGEEFQFSGDTKQSRFIFDKKIDAYIKEVYDKSCEFHFLCQKEKSSLGSEFDKVSGEKNKIFKWFIDELSGKLPTRFEKFLKI